MYGAVPVEAPGRQRRAFADGRDRRHPRRAHRRAQAGDHRHEDADQERNDHVRVSKSSPVFGSVKPTASNSDEQALRERETEEEPGHRCEHAHDQGLEQHDTEDLPPRGADRPQRRELAGPLSDRDRQRVGDHERADEEGDAAEGEQEVLQEAGEALRVARVRLRLVRAAPDLRRRRQDRCAPPRAALPR